MVAAAAAATTACSGWSAATTQALVAEGNAERVRAREAPAAPAPSTRSTAGARSAAALATADPSTEGPPTTTIRSGSSRFSSAAVTRGMPSGRVSRTGPPRTAAAGTAAYPFAVDSPETR